MPGGDRTGPYGIGPMTGRAAGFCAALGVPGYANLAARGCRAWGRGRGGGGRGFRNVFYGMPAWGNSFAYGGPYYAPTTATTRQELDALRAQAEYLEDALEGIRMQLKELEEKQTGAPAG